MKHKEELKEIIKAYRDRGITCDQNELIQLLREVQTLFEMCIRDSNSSAPYTNFRVILAPTIIANWYTAHLLFQSKVKTGLRPFPWKGEC